MIVTGIGSRRLPLEPDGSPAIWLMTILQEIGQVARINNWILRSGAADGMDSLFEVCWSSNKEIYIPWNGFNNRWDGKDGAIFIPNSSPVIQQAQNVVSKVHPVWSRLKSGAKALHTRNVFQALGQYLIDPADICIYYAPITASGEVDGGTRTAVEICKSYNVPTFNLKITDDVVALRALLNTWKQPHDTIIRDEILVS